MFGCERRDGMKCLSDSSNTVSPCFVSKEASSYTQVQTGPVHVKQAQRTTRTNKVVGNVVPLMIRFTDPPLLFKLREEPGMN